MTLHAPDPAIVPRAVREVLQRLEGAGHESFLVGGVVRDLLLGRHRAKEADWDLATRARPETIQGLFRRVVPTGIAHGTVTVVHRGLAMEVTTYRGESTYSDGRHPDTVHYLDRIEDDLARRDFTINAIAWNPLRSDLRDPFGGRNDLEARRLRAVGDPVERFAEDGLRPLRAVRFAAVLGFEIEGATLAAIPGSLPVYARVAVERLAQEMDKLLLGAHADLGLLLLHRTGLSERILPGLGANVLEGRASLTRLPPDRILRWAGLFAPLGPSAGDTARSILSGLRASKALVRATTVLLDLARDPPAPDDAASLRRRLARLRGAPGASAERLATLWEVFGGAPAAARALRHEAATHPPLTVTDLALTGEDVMATLGTGAGPQVGRTLRALLEHVLDHPEENTRSALVAHLRRMHSSTDAS